MLPEQVLTGVTVVPEAADSETSRALQRSFFADISARYPGWTPATSQSVEPSDLAPPNGVWLVVYLGDHAVGCGGLQRLDDQMAEIRRVFLDEQARGRGIGRMLLAELEQHASKLGYDRVVLTTGDQQPEALNLFQSQGYTETAPFTAGAFTSHWMEKQLRSSTFEERR